MTSSIGLHLVWLSVKQSGYYSARVGFWITKYTTDIDVSGRNGSLCSPLDVSDAHGSAVNESFLFH
jgi:hypothetical protein